MAITTDQKYLLNTKAGRVANTVQLGTLIENAEAGGLAAGSVTATELASDAVTTAKILNANVTLAKLASGIAPSHVVKYAGKFTTLGGDANEAISVAGVAATDVVLVTVQTAGGTPRTIVSAIPATNAINVVMSGDPSTDHILSYVVFRAAA